MAPTHTTQQYMRMTPFAMLAKQAATTPDPVKDTVDNAWNWTANAGRGVGNFLGAIGKGVAGLGHRALGGATSALKTGYNLSPFGLAASSARQAADRSGEGLGGFVSGLINGANPIQALNRSWTDWKNADKSISQSYQPQRPSIPGPPGMQQPQQMMAAAQSPPAPSQFDAIKDTQKIAFALLGKSASPYASPYTAPAMQATTSPAAPTGAKVGPPKWLQQANVFQQPAQPSPAITPEMLTAFRKGTASAFDPKSKMDQFKMRRLLGGDAQWADNAAFRASTAQKAASLMPVVNSVIRAAPRAIPGRMRQATGRVIDAITVPTSATSNLATGAAPGLRSRVNSWMAAHTTPKQRGMLLGGVGGVTGSTALWKLKNWVYERGQRAGREQGMDRGFDLGLEQANQNFNPGGLFGFGQGSINNGLAYDNYAKNRQDLLSRFAGQ